MAIVTFKREDPISIREQEEKNRVASEKRKRVEELKLKDKLAQFETMIKNMGEKIDALEENNKALQKEIEDQDLVIKHYVSKSMNEMIRRSNENSIYGIPKGIRDITDCRALEDLYRFNPDENKISEKDGNILEDFDKPNQINSDQFAVNSTFCTSIISTWSFKRFFARQVTKEIYIPLDGNRSTKFLVVNFKQKNMYYSVIESFKDPRDPNHHIRKEVYTCMIDPKKEPTCIQTKIGNYCIRNVPNMGRNFCLYIDFLKWRVSMYRYEASSNSWVIHDFIELDRSMDISWADKSLMDSIS